MIINWLEEYRALPQVIWTDAEGIEIGPHRYFVEWAQIKDAASILGWVSHLSEKNWFTQRICIKFIDASCRHLKIKYRPI